MFLRGILIGSHSPPIWLPSVVLQGYYHPLPRVITNLLQEFKDVFPVEIPSGLPPLRGSEHQFDFRAHHCLTELCIGPIQRRQRKFSDKSKNCWTMGTYVRALVLVLFLLFWFLRKMVLDICVLIVEL
jgi:hypothetical protein